MLKPPTGRRLQLHAPRKEPDTKWPFTCYRCHSFVRDGQIEFLGDCTHELAGKTVPLEPF
ncbi:MAG: hypothetical protein QM754_18485 [Tepidisphaeraceae bacterium]